MQLFHANQYSENEAWLDEEEALHCTRTLRKQTGDIIYITDGKGQLHEAVISRIEKKRVLLTLQQALAAPVQRNFELHIAIAPTKNIDRIEFFLEKATEIGIDSITPLRCQRSERREVRLDRLDKIVQSAAKQSLQIKFPVLNEMIDFQQFIKQPKAELNFIAHCNSNELPHLSQKYRKGASALVLIGPEGDFSPAEVAAAQAAGFMEISLGKSRLRTETAGIAACMLLHFCNEI